MKRLLLLPYKTFARFTRFLQRFVCFPASPFMEKGNTDSAPYCDEAPIIQLDTMTPKWEWLDGERLRVALSQLLSNTVPISPRLPDQLVFLNPGFTAVTSSVYLSLQPRLNLSLLNNLRLFYKSRISIMFFLEEDFVIDWIGHCWFWLKPLDFLWSVVWLYQLTNVCTRPLTNLI